MGQNTGAGVDSSGWETNGISCYMGSQSHTYRSEWTKGGIYGQLCELHTKCVWYLLQVQLKPCLAQEAFWPQPASLLQGPFEIMKLNRGMCVPFIFMSQQYPNLVGSYWLFYWIELSWVEWSWFFPLITSSLMVNLESVCCVKSPSQSSWDEIIAQKILQAFRTLVR